MKARINKETVQKLAHLSRLSLDEVEQVNMQKRLNEMLDWVCKLDELDTTGVEPLTHMSEELAEGREDIIVETLNQEGVFLNAPVHDREHFIVPKVVK